MLEIWHPDYTKQMKFLFPIFLIIFLSTFIIPIVILISDPMEIYGYIFLLFCILINSLVIWGYFFKFQISTIIFKDKIILKSLKRKIIISKDSIIRICEKGYIQIYTKNKRYGISTQNVETKKEIMSELIKNKFPVVNYKGELTRDPTSVNIKDDVIKERYKNEKQENIHKKSRTIFILGIVTSIIIIIIYSLLVIIFTVTFIQDIFIYSLLIMIAILGFITLVARQIMNSTGRRRD